jgi:glutamate-1-semialdehyde 2,1-aminomutase
MAAGTVSLRLLTDEAIARLNELGDTARTAVQARVADAGWEVRGRGSLLRPIPQGAVRINDDLRCGMWWAAHDRGLLITPANMISLSTPMTEAVVADIADRLADAVLEVADA